MLCLGFEPGPQDGMLWTPWWIRKNRCFVRRMQSALQATDPCWAKANLSFSAVGTKNNFVWLRHKINFPVVAWWPKSQRFSSLRISEKLGKSSAPCESLTDKSEAITTSLVEKTIKETLRGKVEFFLWEKRFQRLVGFLKQNFSKEMFLYFLFLIKHINLS